MANRDSGRYIVAFEIGSSKVRGAIGIADSANKTVEVVAIEEEKLTDKVRYGCIQNMEVGNALLLVVERLQAYQQVAPREITGAYIALGGRTLWSSVADVQVDLVQETEITTPIIKDLCHQAEATVSADRDVVDVVPVKFTVDNKVQNNPIGAFGKSVGARMTVLSCSQQLKKMLRRVVNERLGLTICDYVTRVLAEADITLTDDERRLGCMFVDFGAETTSVAIYKNGTPAYVTTLPMGSRNITLDLTSLNCLEERAEEIKKSVGHANLTESGRHQSSADGLDYTEINNYIHARADEIIANIMAQMEYAGFRSEELHEGIVIVGGGCRLKGFNDLLAQQTKMKIRMGGLPSYVRLTDGSLSDSESLDVIATLCAAAKMPACECVSELPAMEDTEESNEGAGNYEELLRKSGGEPGGTSRIGRLGEEDYGENGGTYEEEEEDDSNKKKQKGGDKPKGGGMGSMLSNLMRRISAIVDAEEDESEEQ